MLTIWGVRTLRAYTAMPTGITMGEVGTVLLGFAKSLITTLDHHPYPRVHFVLLCSNYLRDLAFHSEQYLR